MTVSSRFQSLALPILISDPLILSPRRGYIETLTRDISNYSHTISNTRGYDKAAFQLETNLVNAEDWLINGLGRHIVVKGNDLVTVWEGFVNKIKFDAGSISISSGPLLEVGNKVSVTYSTVDTSTDPPTVGIRATTSVAEDSGSQAKFGIIEKILSQGGVTTTLAEQVRDKFLQEGKNPPRSSDDNFTRTNQPSVKIDCLGYYYWFDTYIYNIAGPGEQNISTQLTDIITADPNGIFSTDFRKISTNTVQAKISESDDARAKTLIEDLVGIGDASDRRYNFMVLADRVITYEPAPTTVELIYRVTEKTKQVTDIVGNRIRPWSVLPGKWRRTPDIFVGRSQPSNLKDDLRNSYVVQVAFRAPNELKLAGDELEELPQLLSKVSAGINITA